MRVRVSACGIGGSMTVIGSSQEASIWSCWCFVLEDRVVFSVMR